MRRILLNPFDVVSLKPHQSFSRISTSKVIDLINSLLSGYTGVGRVLINLDEETILAWLMNGVEAEVLQSGKEWKKGKLCVAIQFFPDEPENLQVIEEPQKSLPPSPLDDLRQQLKDLNQ